MLRAFRSAPLALVCATLATTASAQMYCRGYGPQTPRDITQVMGTNARMFALAPPASRMNLCNIHTHTQAEHMGPGFSIFDGEGPNGGYRCNDTNNLTFEEMHSGDHSGAYHGVVPGDTIEVHWVYTSCEVAPGPGLGACLSEACANPQLRVESQVFLVVNDDTALDFEDFDYGGAINGLHQPKNLPSGTGRPVVFHGSTTGTSYTQEICSPLQVTWSVRPDCARLDIASLHAWAAEGNRFEENHSHGVRPLVTAPELLAPIND